MLEHKTRILAIDDEVGFTRLLKIAASKLYEVRGENDPFRALQTARDFHPDIILLDRFMGQTRGEDLLSSIKADDVLHDVPVAFITATVPRNEDDSLRTTLHGCPILKKPVSIDQIEEVVRRCVGA
jgi:DNA-binding response OmpR family regulator